jgi:hypothetical protein
MTRRRKILFRLTLGGASVLAIQLIVLGFGGYGSTLPSSERILPAPPWFRSGGIPTERPRYLPSSVAVAGWYDLDPRPGQLGPAVILGHVDSYTGPAVFFRLRSLLPGDIITVRSGGQTLRFAVTKLLTYARDHFPTMAVFGSTPDPELRLITCSGPFDRSTGHYTDNLVVFAIRTV